MSIFHMTLLLLLTSCALFKGEKSLKGENQLTLLNAIQLTGEGRGRLTMHESQYLFSYESALQENFDWILGVEIPLHGEEIMLFPDLRKKYIRNAKMESFEARLTEDFHRMKLNKILRPQEFMQGLRELVRFILAKRIGLERKCQENENELQCFLDKEIFITSVNDKEFLVSKQIKQGVTVTLSGSVLTKSFFEKTIIHLFVSDKNLYERKPSLSLELFWKN